MKGGIGHEVDSFATTEDIDSFIKAVEDRKEEIAHAEYSTFIDGVLRKIYLVMGDEEQMATTPADAENVEDNNQQ